MTLADGTEARRSSSHRQCDLAAARLSGERLKGLAIDATTGTTTFHFDLGAVLTAQCPRSWRNDDDGELWSLRGPNRRYVAVRAGGYYTLADANKQDPPMKPVSSASAPVVAVVVGQVRPIST